MTDANGKSLSSSEGSVLSEAAYLDEHFQACQPEYEAMLQSVMLRQGWHVLDAGCGSGSFLPLISKLVGEFGQITAIDIAPENVAVVEERIAKNEFLCPINTRVSSVVSLPFEDNTFDAIWCAAITQYLSDEDLRATLNEFQRVLKSGGLLALKDFSVMCMQWQPLDPLLLSRLLQSQTNRNDEYAYQSLRNASLPSWTRDTGFVNVNAHTTMVERMQPLRDVERTFFGNLIGFIATRSLADSGFSESDHLIWKQLADTKSKDHILYHPDFYYSEGHIVVTAFKSLD